MSDEIVIRDLHLRTIIGINDDERRKRQDVLINLVLKTDLRAAAASDDIADAVNYRTITKQVIQLVESSQYFLVERLADEICRLVLADERITSVRVSVDKPGALRFARSVSVVLERTRNDG